MTAEFRPVLVVPVYNHGDVFAETYPLLQRAGLPVVAVDDGSNTETAATLAALALDSTQLTIVTHPANEGKGAAVISGIRYAAANQFTHVLQIDADGQHNPADIERFLQAGLDHPKSMIVGKPSFDDSIPLSRHLGRYLTHVLIWIETLSFEISDSMCGFRLYPLSATLPVVSGNLGQRMDFDPEILVRLHWLGTPMVKLDTRVIYPDDGHSNFRLLQDNVLISTMHTRLLFGMILRLPKLLRRRLTAFQANRSGPHWATIAEKGSLLGLRFMMFVYRTFGRWLFQPIAALVAGYFVLTSASARNASREFLDQVWRHSKGRSSLKRKPDIWTSIRHFYCFADAILDKVAAWRGDISYKQIIHENLALFEGRVREGRGGVWVTSHLGNIEVCRAIGQQDLDLKLTVLMHTRHAENFNQLLREVAPDSHVELMEVTEFNMAAALKLQDRVSRGRFIIIVGDRVPIGDRARLISCNFLGRQADFPMGPFLLAALLDCPAGTLFCVREGNRFRLVIDDLPGLSGLKRSDRPQAIETAARTYVQRLESLCLRYPLQWFNFYPFWSINSDSNHDQSVTAS